MKIRLPVEVVVIAVGCVVLAFGGLLMGALSFHDGGVFLTLTDHTTTGVTVYTLWPLL